MILKFIERHFAMTISSSVFIGMFLGYFIETGERYDYFMGKYMIIWLFTLMVITSLKVDLEDLKKSFKEVHWIFILIIAKLLLFPFLAYFLSWFVPTEYRIGLVLLASLPAAIASTGLLIPLKGNIARGLVISVLSNLIAPFVLPFILLYTVGTYVDLDVWSMFLLIFGTTVVPFLLSLIMKRFTPKVTKPISDHSTPIISLGIMSYLIVLFISYSKIIYSEPKIALYSVLTALAFFIFSHLFSVLVSIKEKKSDMISNIIVLAYLNLALGTVIGIEYFDITATLVVIVYNLNVFGLIPLQLIFAKRKSSVYNSAA